MRRSVTRLMFERIASRKATRAEWHAWKRYWKLLMREGPTERTLAAERQLWLLMVAAVTRQTLLPAYKRLAKAAQDAAPALVRFAAAFERR
jgi:hypothetical protein